MILSALSCKEGTGVWWGDLIVLLHLLCSFAILGTGLWIFLTLRPFFSRLARCIVLLCPIGSLVHIIDFFQRECRTVTADEFLVSLGLAAIYVWAIYNNWQGRKCTPCLYDVTRSKC
jgi:hypothetical protein